VKVVKQDEKKVDKKPEQEVVVKKNTWPIDGLPSRGIFYPEGTVLMGRPLKVLEIKMLSSMTEETANYVINDILKRTVTGLPLDQMLVADKLYIVFWLRANTYKDSGYKVGFECSKCHQEAKFAFNLDDLTVKDVADDYNPEKILKLKESKTKLTFTYTTVKDENLVDAFKEKNKSNPMMVIDEDVLSIASMVDTIDGEDVTLKTKYEFVTGITAQEYIQMESYLKETTIGIVPIINVECDVCGGTGPTGISFRADFFIPEYTN